MCRILTIGQKVVDGVTPRISEIAVAKVEGVENGMCGKHAVSNFGTSFS